MQGIEPKLRITSFREGDWVVATIQQKTSGSVRFRVVKWADVKESITKEMLAETEEEGIDLYVEFESESEVETERRGGQREGERNGTGAERKTLRRS